MSPIRLGLNVDHVATLRNARGGVHPDPLAAAEIALAAGADSITIHLREDRRHIRDTDLARMRERLVAPINLEMAATEEMVAIACAARPHACCLVPEHRTELTTEGGLDAAGQEASLRGPVARLSAAGIAVSLFIDPDPSQVVAAARLGAAAVELHTGQYAEGGEGELARLATAARLAAQLRITCHAGHGLTFGNVAPVAAIPEVVELNIGHFLIGQAILEGLGPVVAKMKRLMEQARGG
ncbi:MAG TPA: pyridoxine 5'-phosphate synthase [Acetobacteraceae bacterium]|nr:pyridoxine 5'-phosphate synthase [Acetobacteraceae bacterium]